MKNQFVFRFKPLPAAMGEFVDRRRLAQMFRSYRSDRRKYRILRIPDGYSVTCGLATAIISRI